MLKYFSVIFSLFIIHYSLFADDCLQYKLSPNTDVSVPEWRVSVVQPLKPMDMWHGNVVATLAENFTVIVDTTPAEDGVCIALKSVAAEIGYSDFTISIDSRNRPNSCTYNEILVHENEHVRTYLSVIDDAESDIKSAVLAASDSVMPTFVQIGADTDIVMDEINSKLQNHPKIILMRQKISAEQEIRNKRLDSGKIPNPAEKCSI